MKKKHVLLLILFVLIFISPTRAEMPEAPPELQDEKDVYLQMKELGIVIPVELQERLDIKGWVVWKITTIPIGNYAGEFVYCVKYLTQDDNERYHHGEIYRCEMLKAEAFFCKEHKNLAHFRWFDGGMWHEQRIPEKEEVKIVKKPEIRS